jgi:hypothetical protein
MRWEPRRATTGNHTTRMLGKGCPARLCKVLQWTVHVNPVCRLAEPRYWHRCALVALLPMRARRLEDRIRGLCAHAAVAQQPELNTILSELRSALRKHTERLRVKALERLVSGEPKERRQAPIPALR